MVLANILGEQMHRFSMSSLAGSPLTSIEWLVTTAWQWLVLVAVTLWLGTLVAEYHLLNACKGEQRAEIVAILLVARRRQLQQSWLWLSIALVGMLALFWLRVSRVLPDQQLNAPPDWPTLAGFLLNTSEGWLWLARSIPILLAFGILTFITWRQAYTGHRSWPTTNRKRSTHSLGEVGTLSNSGQGENRPALLENWTSPPARFSAMRGTLGAGYIAHAHQMLSVGKRLTQCLMLVAGTILLAMILAESGMQVVQLPFSTIALDCTVLLALTIWLGKVVYFAFVIAPASRVVENAERTQAVLELFQSIRPPITQAAVPLLLYGIFSLETYIHLSSPGAMVDLLQRPAGWIVVAGAILLGGLILLTLYQARRILPALARMAWFAARGTITSVLGGMDVSRALQISQIERQSLANHAERRLMRTLYMQTILGLLLLLCLVVTALLPGR